MAEIGDSPNQSDCKPSVLRSGQFNFGLVQLNRPNWPFWEPTETMFVSKPAAWERNYRRESCYPNPKWIESEEDLQSLIEFLESQDEFCLHVKLCSFNSVIPYTTLIQVATWNRGDFLISAMLLQEAIAQKFKSVLENPAILKILCDSERQVTALQRDYSIFINGIADVLELAKFTQSACTSYYQLCKAYPSIDCFKLVHPPSKTLIQKSSHDNFIHYAAHEVHFVLRIFNRLRRQASKDELAQLFNNLRILSEKLCQVPSEEESCISPLKATNLFLEHFTNDKELWTENIQFKNFENRSKQAIVAVLEFREMLSKTINVSPEKIITDRKIFELCRHWNPIRRLLLRYVSELDYIIGPQQTLLLDILCSEHPEKVMADLREYKCMNCSTTGHGTEDFCIFPQPPGNKPFMLYFDLFNSFFDFPENNELKKAYEIQVELFSRRQQQREQEAVQALQLLQNMIW